MIFIAYLNRWLAKAAVRAQLRKLGRAEEETRSEADAAEPEPEVERTDPGMDDSPPGHKVRWWL